MENSISKSLVVVNNTLEAEGFALAKEYKSITKGDKARFTKATKADGFDTRLGKLMQKLKAEGGERISSDRLKDCGINGIDKRRRSEALWFVENETACREFIQASKKGFTSLTALQAAMKPKAAPKPKADTETPVKPEAEDKSKVGLDSEADKVETKSASDIALEALVQCELNGVSKAKFIAALKEQLEMLDDSTDKSVIKDDAGNVYVAAA
tara:strand:- start:33 stop:668 length:636 start_codon:yes stop_codon:yes gene_type:complete